MNNVLVILDGDAKHLFINGQRIDQMRSIGMHAPSLLTSQTVTVEFGQASYKVAHREYGMHPDQQAARYFDTLNPPQFNKPCPINFGGFTATVGDMTIREFQTNLPWSIKYSEDFRRNPQTHKDFAHALTHVHKAAGKLSAFVDDMDHRKETALDAPFNQGVYAQYVADLVICALRMANTFPGGVIDLHNAVKNRLETKNGVTL